MSDVTYLHGWNASLCITLDNGRKCDFNRLIYKGTPKTKILQQSSPFESAHRDKIILQLKSRFDEKINEGVSNDSLFVYFSATSQYINWCDSKSTEAFSQSSLESYFNHLADRVKLEQITTKTYKTRLSAISAVIRIFLYLPLEWYLIPSSSKITKNKEQMTRAC
ncbi:phage integrase N-terminal SAM-like domain-containing protein [Vibrio lentus]|nr:phage integrase N-terminal SAM-like domain-containing protein [Vibrio lentus]PMI58439.1 hypothetical protein BCU43_01205 [Vibrio lentus]